MKKDNDDNKSEKSDKDDKDDKVDKEELEDVESKKIERSVEDIEKELIDIGKGKKSTKALFIQRLIAFFIDVLIVSFITSLIAFPFANDKKATEINKQASEVSQQLLDNKVSFEEYTYKYIDLTYDLAKNNGIITIITLAVELLYFVVFQIYNNGSTIGKKFMKIRVESTNGDLTMNQMIFRSFLANSILVDLLSLIFLLFTNKNVYFYCVGLFSLIQYATVIVSIFMIMYSKDGRSVHDRLFHTKVVRMN